MSAKWYADATPSPAAAPAGIEKRATSRPIGLFGDRGVLAPDLLRSRGYAFVRVEDTHDPAWARSVAAGDTVVFDGYEFNEADYSTVRSRGATIVRIDDFGHGEFDVDVLVNPAGADHGADCQHQNLSCLAAFKTTDEGAFAGYWPMVGTLDCLAFPTLSRKTHRPQAKIITGIGPRTSL